MKDVTKLFYPGKPWVEIVGDPGYTLGQREIEGLERFLAQVSNVLVGYVNLLHLGVGGFRELPVFNQYLALRSYVINDICRQTVETVVGQAKGNFPNVGFIGVQADVEAPGVVGILRERLFGRSVIALVGNAVIFSNRQVGEEIRQAMRPGDLFLLTLEEWHEGMFDSYRIPACLELLSQSGIDVRPENSVVWYDESDHCLKVSCEDRVLLASYKPTPEQLSKRMHDQGFVEVKLSGYPDIHMLGGLFRRA